MGNNKTQLKKEFIKIIAERFESWNDSKDGPPDLEKLIMYLIGCSIIPEKQINRFMIVDYYPKILKANEGKKLRTIYTLEDIINIQQTQIYNILKNYSKTFRYNKNLIE